MWEINLRRSRRLLMMVFPNYNIFTVNLSKTFCLAASRQFHILVRQLKISSKKGSFYCLQDSASLCYSERQTSKHTGYRRVHYHIWKIIFLNTSFGRLWVKWFGQLLVLIRKFFFTSKCIFVDGHIPQEGVGDASGGRSSSI